MPSSRQPWIVLKFGGSSVSTPQRWRRIARIVQARLARGERPLLVCSALGGVTNRLEALATRPPAAERAALLDALTAQHRALGDALGIDAGALLAADFAHMADLAADPTLVEPPQRAELLALGERMSTRLGAAWLTAVGLPTAWVDARALLVAEEAPEGSSAASRYLAGTCAAGPDPMVEARLADHDQRVIITQGFTARDDQGQTVLLGRGGSDTSGAYLASRVSARRLEIWSDVPGLFTAHPKRHPLARLVRRLSYTEAEALAGLGARALHPRCLRPLRECGIPLRLGWTERPDIEGTLISGEPEGTGIKAITARTKLHLVSMRRDPQWQPVGFMARVAACFRAHGLSMDLISSSPGDIRVTLDPSAFPGVRDELPRLIEDLEAFCEPTIAWDVASVSLVGREVFGDVSRRAGDLLAEGPEVRMATHAPDDTHMTLVVDAAEAEAIERYLHVRLLRGLPDDDSLFGPTWRALCATDPESDGGDGAPGGGFHAAG